MGSDLFCRLSAEEVLFNEAVSQVQTLLSLLEAILLAMPASPEARSVLAYERHFLYSLAWSIGGLLEPKDRASFDRQLRTIKKDAMPVVRYCPVMVCKHCTNERLLFRL